MRGVVGVRKLIYQSWLAKELWLVLGLRCWGFKKQALFKSAQWHFHQDNAPVHNSILVTDYLTKMGIKTVHHPAYGPNLAPCDFCLFPKLRGCRYETIEEMKETVTKVIDTLTQEDFHGGFQKLLERYNKCIAAGGDYFEGDKSFMCPYEKRLETYLMILVYCVAGVMVEETGTYGSSIFFFLIYIFEVLEGLCVWIEVWEKVFVLVPTFWKIFRFVYLVGCFVMGRLWWLIFCGDKEGIFLMFFL